jgi:hypothetical protein
MTIRLLLLRALQFSVAAWSFMGVRLGLGAENWAARR